MVKEIETKEKKEMYPDSTVSQTTMEKSPFAAHGTNGTTNGMPFPNQVFKIVQHIHPTTLIPQDQFYPTWQTDLVARIMNIINEMSQLTAKKMDKIITMVKDSSITFKASGTWEIKDFFKAALSLNIHQWEYILDKVKREDETVPEDSSQYKLAEIISTARSMKKESFDKLKKLIMGSPSFRTEEEKLTLVEILTKARSMPETEFEVLKGMVKDSSITLTIDKVEEFVKTYTQLSQLTIEQIDEVYKMVKDSSIT